jgi:opacity protein-like surface antigen
MKKLNCVAAILVATWAASIAIDPAAAAAKKQKRQLSSLDQIKLTCLKEIGATVQGGYWYTQGGIGTAQNQRYYDCLDRHTMNKR